MNDKNTPLTYSNGNDRLPDYWQPRSNIRTLFEQKKLSIEDTDAIEDFPRSLFLR